MLVSEFLKQVDNKPLDSYAAPGHYMRLFLAILDEFRDEKCSVLLGKIRGSMSEDFKERAGLLTRDPPPTRVTEKGLNPIELMGIGEIEHEQTD